MGQRTLQQSELYQTSRHVPFADKLSLRARRHLFDRFMEILRPSPTTQILDVGVTCDEVNLDANFFEAWYPYKDSLTCVGIEDASFLEQRYPGLKFKLVMPHARLPFSDQQFDIVYSNAVIEHVGTRDQQREFVRELCRVGKQVFLVAPNRLFPVEHHTALPVAHYLPNSLFRKILNLLGLTFWSDPQKLNLFFPWEMKRFFPRGLSPKLCFAGIGLGFFRSNVFAYTRPKKGTRA